MTRARMTVRQADLADLSTIVELRLALMREYHDHPLYAALRPDAEQQAYDLFRSQLQSPAEGIFVAERGPLIVGVLRCVEVLGSPLLYPDRYCYVSSVYVRPPHRRTGVLRALLARATEWCDERGIDEMRLHNAPASTAARAWDALEFEIVEHVRRRRLSIPAISQPSDAGGGAAAVGTP